MGPTPFYGARAEKPHFALKANEYVALAQVSGDIKIEYVRYVSSSLGGCSLSIG